MIIDAPAPRHIPALRTLWQQTFGDTDAFLDSFFSLAYAPQRCRCVLDGDTVAAALYWFECTWEGRPIAYLYAVATDKKHRGKGLCRRLTEDTHAHLKTLGYHGSILVPAEQSLFEMYEKLGYKTCSAVREFTCAAGEPIPLRQLTAQEYASLRRSFLPAGGVVQEEEALALLQAHSAFYAGDNCLLTCSAEDSKLTVHELLGDESAAAGIAAALGFPEGKFRTPGSENPFAMYYPLTEDLSAPTYFGLALD